MRKKFLSAVLLLAALGVQLQAQELSELIPVDPQITLGTLENGLRYYVRPNKKPEKRAELRLVVNAGSVLEEEDQQGLAHFVEHMAFNGTLHFPKMELVSFLESLGIRFGPDLNAYTSFDETVYLLQVPTDEAEILEQAFLVLEDWAHNLSFDPEEIDKERGVVVEEWRRGRGAQARMLDRQWPILFRGSRYAQRLPIGQKAVLDTFRHEALMRFYREWYRPELMAVIAVGDFDRERVEGLIREHFSRIPARETARERPLFPVPDHEETLFAMVSDPEATFTEVDIVYKQAVREEKTVGDYRRLLVENLYLGMLNQRLRELTLQANPPFVFGLSFQQRFMRSKEVYLLVALANPNEAERAFEALLIEAERARRFGFLLSELERQKKELLSALEQAFNERDKTPSEQLASEYARHFLIDEPIPGIEREFTLARQFFPGIEPGEIDQVAQTWLSGRSRVVLVGTPEGPEVQIPSEEVLRGIMARVGEMELQPYAEELADLPLIEAPPAPSEIVAEEEIPELEVTEWTLGNGARVVLKPTDFQNDQILLTAYSPGGHSLVPDEDFVPAITAAAVVQEGGLGRFNQIELQKKLAGQVVEVSPWIGPLEEGLSGSAAPRYAETLFQLIYLYFTAPREDPDAFLSYQAFLRGVYENARASPERAFADTVQALLSQHHFRARPFSVERVEEMDLERSLAVYRQRFAEAGDFTFFFVGNVDLAQFRPLVQTYLGGLPATGREETWRDVGIRPPRGVIRKTVLRGREPKSQTQIVFTGPFAWGLQNRFALDALVRLLRIKLRERLREALEGTYGVAVWASPSRWPEEQYELSIYFGSAPENAGRLAGEVFAQIDSLKRFGPAAADLAKVKEQQRRERETEREKNEFWLNLLRFSYLHEEDPQQIVFGFEERVAGLTGEALQQVAQRYLDTENYAQVVLLPAEGITAVLAGEELSGSRPREYALFPNVPNPFNATTQIAYQLPEAGEVSLVIYNASGQQVHALVRDYQKAGYYQVQWDGKDGDGREVASGVYVVRLAVNGFAKARKMMVIR